MKDQIMNIRFLEDDNVEIEFRGKKEMTLKDILLYSLQHEIVNRGFVVNNEISKQDVGEFIYYQFYYFDQFHSRNIRFQIPKNDIASIYSMDQIRSNLANKGILFEDEKTI